MLFRTSAVVLVALLAQSALATDCPAGKRINMMNQCVACADGSISTTPNSRSCTPCAGGTESNTAHTSCTPCAAGYASSSGHQCTKCSAGTQPNSDQSACVTCPDGYVSNPAGSYCQACPAGQENNPGHTNCKDCSNGSYSTGGTACMKCPAGQIGLTSGTRDHCNKCNPGSTSSSGSTSCTQCQGGYFNNNTGANTCCKCCAGWYSVKSGSGSTSCVQCPSDRPYSFPGSNENGDCSSSRYQGSGPLKQDRGVPTESCSLIADNVCPNPTGSGPTGTAIARKKRDLQCTKGFTACPRYAGRGGFDCVDTENDPESCGGCVGLDGQGSGTDCTAIKGVSVTRCVNRSCVVDSCRKGWVKSIDGDSCVLVSRTTGSGSESTGLYAQDQSGKKKRSSTKRSIRANIY